MAEVKNDEISWILSLHDLATPKYQQAVQRFKAESRQATDALNEQDEAYRRLCKSIIQYKELETQTAKVWTQAEVAQERLARGLSKTEEHYRRLRTEHARLPWMNLKQGADAGGTAIKGLNGQVGMAISLLGRMPGPLGSVGRAFGGLGRAISGVLGPVGSIIATFTIAYTATRKLVDALGLFPDPMEKVKRANQQAKVAADAAAEAFERQRDVWIETLEKEAAYADKAIAKADQQAAAYLRLQRAKEAVNKAVDDGIMLEMERAKYEDVLTAGGMYGAYKDWDGNIRTGSPLEAAQVGAYHDVLIAQEKQRRERERADKEIALAEEELAAKEETLAKARRAKQKTDDAAELKAYGVVDKARGKYDQKKAAYERAKKEFLSLDPEEASKTNYGKFVTPGWNLPGLAAEGIVKLWEGPAVGGRFKSKKSAMDHAKEEMDKAESEWKKRKAEMDRFLSIRDRQQGAADSRQTEIDELRQQIEEKRTQRGNLDERQQFELAKLEDAYNKIVLDAEKEEREEWERAVQEEAEEERRLQEENDRIAHERAMQYAKEEAAYAARMAREEKERAALANRQAEARLAEAQSQAARAWGFYRNKDSLVAYGREMDADAAAREQYKKDYYSLVHGRNGSLMSEAQNALRKGGVEDMEGLFTDWRRRKRLSVNEEATMRVAIAEKEQEDAARAAVESRDYLAKIEAYIAQIVADEE